MEIICITCTKGCRAEVWQEDREIKIEGDLCKNGYKYVKNEFKDPRRVLTTTVAVVNSKEKRLSVRTSGPISKKLLFPCMDYISAIRVKPPVKPGEVIVKNLLESGEDLMATNEIKN